MAGDHGLTQHQLDQIYEERIFPVVARNVDTYVDRPTAVFLAGAPGAGKSVASDQVPKRLGATPMTLDGDQVRHFHPDYQQLAATNPALAIEVSSGAVDVWLQRLRSDATLMGMHISDETTLRRPELLMDIARDLKHNGYQVEVQVLATHPQISAAATIARTESQIARTGTGRVVPLEYHDQLIDNLADAANKLNNRPGLVDSLTVTTRDGTVLWEGPGTPGPGDIIRGEFNRSMTATERADFAEMKRWVGQAQNVRAASPTERRPMERVNARGPHRIPPPDPNKLKQTSRFRRPRLRRRPPPPGPKPGPRPA